MNFVKCDIRSLDEVQKSLKDVDLVIHTAIIQIPLINENKRLGYEVNFLGTSNICKVVDESPRIKGMILSGTWHTIGERDLSGIINEEFGFRPDKVEDRARLYALSKMAQEAMVRFFNEISNKTYSVIRMGTVLGDGMPEKTAANIFISNGLSGKPITPFKDSMYRPMLYVDIEDICNSYEIFIRKIIKDGFTKAEKNIPYVVNIYYPQPITILELAEIAQAAIIKSTRGQIKPELVIIDQGKPPLFTKDDKTKITVDMKKSVELLGSKQLTDPAQSIERIVKARLSKT
jgi:UDP-glucose 4-epimerase